MADLYRLYCSRLPKGRAWDFFVRHTYIALFAAELFFSDVFFRVIYRGAGHTRPWALTPNLLSILWCMIFAAAALILPCVIGRVFIVASTVFYNVCIIVHCGMYSFSGRFFSFSDMMFADDGAAFFSSDYVRIRIISVLAVAAAVTASAIAAALKPRGEVYSLRRVLAAVIAAAAGVGGICAADAMWRSAYVSVSWDSYRQESDLYQSFTDTPNCMLLTGLFQYTARDMWLSAGGDEWFADNAASDASVAEYYGAREMPDANEMTGIFSGKNLILVQLEATDTWMLTEEAMPNLYALREKSVVFENHYAPMFLSGGTFNTEIMVNLGLFPPVYGGKTGLYAGNEFPVSLPRLFSGEGYTVRSFHNSRAEVYSRCIVHKNWGYERYYSGDDIGMRNIEFDSDLIAGFDMMTEGDRFFSFIITYSGHGAYIGSEVSEKYYGTFEKLHPDADAMYIHALAHAYETDLFIGELVSALENEGLREDTVLAFYSDHYNYYTLDDALVMKYKDVYDKNLIKHVLFFINDTDTGHMSVDKVTSSIDILPTLADLFGLDAGARFYAGDSAFSDCGGYVIFEDYSWYDGKRYYIAGQSGTDGDAVVRNREISDRIYYSNRILLTDWFSSKAYKNIET